MQIQHLPLSEPYDLSRRSRRIGQAARILESSLWHPVHANAKSTAISVKRLPVISRLFVALVVLALTVGCETSGTEKVDGQGKALGTVQLEIDFRSERQKLSLSVPCTSDSTVLSVLQQAKESGDLEFQFTGQSETAFVTSIGGVENMGAEGDNWVYRVNGELGDRSCGKFSVKPDDHVLWVFGKYP